jgi:hypothetical protein
MRPYVATTGVLFAAITVAHIWRAVEEGTGVAKDPLFIILTLAAAALSIWAGILLRPVKSLA